MRSGDSRWGGVRSHERRAEQAALLLDAIKNAPEEKKLLESAHRMEAEDAEMLRAASAHMWVPDLGLALRVCP
eukprot:3809316-Prymnesium_polylepis.1